MIVGHASSQHIRSGPGMDANYNAVNGNDSNNNHSNYNNNNNLRIAHPNRFLSSYLTIRCGENTLFLSEVYTVWDLRSSALYEKNLNCFSLQIFHTMFTETSNITCWSFACITDGQKVGHFLTDSMFKCSK